jgi:hypothetical protein
MVTGESAKETVKTIAQGMPADAVYPWLLTPVLSCCTGGLGCNAHPAFPAPSFDFEGGLFHTSDISCRENDESRGMSGNDRARRRPAVLPFLQIVPVRYSSFRTSALREGGREDIA